MHMSDALMSPGVSGAMLLTTTAFIGYSTKKVDKENMLEKLPLMGTMGAFVFAVQMINFAIPGTGSSGHLAGGLLLVIILGPYSGFLTMATVLFLQALLFGDGGLLAYGANVFNLGVIPAFIVYPLIYAPLVKILKHNISIMFATIISAIMALQLGSFSVVLETLFSGKTELPLLEFALFMQPIHLIIGLVEGFITAFVIIFLLKSKKELLYTPINISSREGRYYKKNSKKSILIGLLLVSLIIGAGLSSFASSYPDGLEWSIEKTSKTPISSTSNLHSKADVFQKKSTLFPDYTLEGMGKIGENLSGLAGTLITFLAVVIIGFTLYFIKRKTVPKE